MGQSRNENILENILGASNPLGAPQSREEALLMQLLEKLDVTVLKWIGVTTTALSDGSTTNPITIDGKSVTAVAGDTASYNSKEFVFNGTIWQEFGDLDSLLRIIGNTYSSTSTYALGDYVIHSSALYKCTTAITTAEEWNGSHWTQTTIGAELVAINAAIGNKMDKANPTGTGDLTMTGDILYNGSTSLTSKIASIEGTILTGTLESGETTLVINSSSLVNGSIVEIWTDVYGLKPTNVAVSSGSVTLTFLAQGVDVLVKVKVM
ncbi:MAG: hypothetical protein IJ880_03365 [Bacilli bacterium]|nr:hypothetical protein [Bacilli bacterium]